MAASAEEIERVYHERYSRFRRATALLVGGEERAHDVVQEGFARALARRKQFRGGSLEAWIWRIVVRAALDVRRRPLEPLEDELEAEMVSSDAQGEGMPPDRTVARPHIHEPEVRASLYARSNVRREPEPAGAGLALD